LNYNF